VGVISVYVAGISGHLCVLMNEMGCLEFWSFYADTDVMQVCTVGADGHMLFCLSGLSSAGAVFSCTQPSLPDLVWPGETNPCNCWFIVAAKHFS
jgi:hypothetical protein